MLRIASRDISRSQNVDTHTSPDANTKDGGHVAILKMHYQHRNVLSVTNAHAHHFDDVDAQQYVDDLRSDDD